MAKVKDAHKGFTVKSRRSQVSSPLQRSLCSRYLVGSIFEQTVAICFLPPPRVTDLLHLIRFRQGYTRSVTAVLYLKDERVVATAGANDGYVPFLCSTFTGSRFYEASYGPQVPGHRETLSRGGQGLIGVVYQKILFQGLPPNSGQFRPFPQIWGI